MSQSKIQASAISNGGGDTALKAELARLEAALKRAEEERDILKKGTAYFAKVSG